MIELKAVSKVYTSGSENPTVQAVNAVDLRVQDGEFLVITGRSGSGKTTLLNLAAGLAKPTGGQVIWDGVDLWSLADERQSALRNQQMGFIFQFPSLLPSLTALENTALPSVFNGKHKASNGRGEPLQQAAQLLKMIGLEDKMYALPRQLSAGQQQRVVVARALFHNPRVLLADEPTSNLDEQTECEIMELLKGIHQRTGATILMVTHAPQLIAYGTRAVEMAGGRVKSNP